jgi:hypothetical protein
MVAQTPGTKERKQQTRKGKKTQSCKRNPIPCRERAGRCRLILCGKSLPMFVRGVRKDRRTASRCACHVSLVCIRPCHVGLSNECVYCRSSSLEHAFVPAKISAGCGATASQVADLRQQWCWGVVYFCLLDTVA